VIAARTFFAERELREGLKRWNQQTLHESLRQKGVEWHFNPPFAPTSGGAGAWEILVKVVKQIFHSIAGEQGFDDECLQTFFVEIESILNNRPLTPVSDDPNDFSTLTPMSLLLGSIDPVFPLDVFIGSDGYRRSWRRVQLLSDRFWACWLKQYLPVLQLRQKWLQLTRNLPGGDLVLMKDEAVRRGIWPKALVTDTFPDQDGIVRRVRIRTAASSCLRDVRKLCLLEASDS